MTAAIIDGKSIAAHIKAEVTDEVNVLNAQGLHPCLAVILVGDDPDSHTYVSQKQKACEQVGIKSIHYDLPSNVAETELLTMIDDLNRNHDIHGILVQLPLPSHINTNKVIESVAPQKDVDGFHPYNIGKLSAGLNTLVSCTPCGVAELIIRSGVNISGKHVVIVGRSNIVGKPLMNLLIQNNKHANATVTLCHTKTNNIQALTSQADILVVAVGKAHFITADMVKMGAMVIDVGINSVEIDGKCRLVGDVEFEAVKNVASYLTPVPGGVGPMTIAMLMKNIAKAASQSGVSIH